ncbi:MAG: GNAT family N-acetyltransferase [Pseudobutyrivibrio sp.]|nr:GNAT family N-acetyltransferase [Pseudobutyrivibrio sp.]
MNYLKTIVRVTEYAALQPDYPPGTLVLTDSQAVIDECVKRGQPVAAFEHDGIEGLQCDNIVLDVDEVDDDVFERIYRRCIGKPWDIAETKRTTIREISMETLDDLNDLVELYSQPGMTDYMEPLFEYEEELQYQKDYIQYIYRMYGFGMWLIHDKATGKLLGRAGIEVRETCDRENQAELGFCISSKHWRKGLAYEVCRKVIDMAMEDYRLTSLIARCNPENIASRHLLEKLGFEVVGYEDDGDCRYFMELD